MRTVLFAAAILTSTLSAQALPAGLQCDITATMITEPADQVRKIDTRMVIKFVDDHSWRVIAQDGVLKSDVALRPMQITNDAYVLAEGSDEISAATGAHIVMTPLTVDRKTGAYSQTTITSKAPNIQASFDLKGHCFPADL